MTDDIAPSRLERLQSVNRSIAKIDRVAADVLTMMERHARMQEIADRQLTATTNVLDLMNRFPGYSTSQTPALND